MAITTEQMRAELVRLFARFDRDGNGFIDEGEFREILKALGENAYDQALKAQFVIIDTDADGAICFEEFVDWWLDYK